ncbi:MAG: hypothetical protein NTZ19_15555 [Bacteroidetes bacterium]|nr:hypothetical protein [Bacteroidota bacterium]
MEYFKIEHSTNKSIIGSTYPQCQHAVHKVSIDDESHIWYQKLGYLDEHVLIPDIILSRLAKKTDLISDVTLGRFLILSDKLKSIIEKYANNSELQLVEIKLIVKKEILNYWILNPIIFRNDFIDFEKSENWIEGSGFIKIREISISNYVEFKQLQESLIYPERVKIHNFKLHSNTNQHFFQLSNLKNANSYFVSEELKNAIEKENCTGIEFELVE